MAFRLYRSNRAENLADALSDVVRLPLAQVFARECIVVQGPGMERWISAVLAQRLGVWANPWFPFPRTAVELILDATLGPAAAAGGDFAPAALVFRIAGRLPALLDRKGFDEVAAYVAGDVDNERLLALSRRLAANFDQYLVYRPELVLQWEQGRDEHFQAQLWRALCAGREPPHLARRIQQLLTSSARPDLEQLPQRVSLFGLSTLPPAFLNVFRAAARHVDVHLFMLTPTRGYWGDVDKSQRHRHDIEGLLANLGKSSRELSELLWSGEEPEEPHGDELFALPEAASLLAGLQADLVELSRRGKGPGFELPPRAAHERDDSLRVHSCHSRTRELEVLRDELRERFERDPSLSPSDAIVFAPDIELYAPVIEAVFGAVASDERTALPFRIADRRTQRASELSSALLALLDLLASRLVLSDVVDLLHRPLVRKRFGIDESELDAAQSWLSQAGARWAIDAQHRESFGQPAYAQNSLRFALDRLLLGYASTADSQQECFGVLPCEMVEGQTALLLGRLARYIETLAQLAIDFTTPRSLAAWSEALGRAMAAMLFDDTRELEAHGLRGVLSEISTAATGAGFDAPVSAKALRSLLEEQLDRARLNASFLSGGITFCEHVPMRAIPFRIVCLLGMDDESFPRSAPRASFDLMQTPRLGDRNLRDDDRQLFLEALLSARDALLVTYVGQSAQDDSVRPASSLVDQLLRVVERHFVCTSADQTLQLPLEGSVRDLVMRRHALHRFDRRYFRAHSDGRFFSYDERALAAARAQLGAQRDPPAFVARPLTAPERGRELSLERLTRFYRHPQRAFLHERLALSLPREIDPMQDREPTLLDTLERYQIGEELLSELRGLSRPERARVLSLAGRLPPGTAGEVQLDAIEALVDAMHAAAQAGDPLPDRDFKLALGEHTLVGRLDGLHEEARVEHTVAQIRTKHKLSAWLKHLVLCASGSAPRRSLLIGRKDDEPRVFEFAWVERAGEQLEALIALYLVGLRMPLPYLHEPAHVLREKLAKGEPLESAFEAASNKAIAAGNTRGGGADADDAHVRQVFSLRQLEDLSSLVAWEDERALGFDEVAQRVLAPLEAHLSERSS